MATSTITGTITDATGTAIAGVTVVARLRPGGGFRTADGSEIVDVTTTTNGSGIWTLALERVAGITPTSSYYEIEEQIPATNGGPRTWAITVGSGNATLYASLLNGLLPAASQPTALTLTAGDARYVAQGAQTFNVKDYGAAGDGATDDTTAVALAVAAATSGGTLIFPPGTYVCAPTFTNKTDLTIVGPGATLKMLNTGSGTRHLLTLAGTLSNVTFVDLTFHSVYAGATATGTYDLLLMGSGALTKARFERCTFKGDVGYTGSGSGTVSQPYMVNMSPTATGGIQDVTFHACRFESPGTGQVAGLLVRGFRGMKVTGCTFVNINNSIVPDNLFQKNDLIFAGNEEVFGSATVNMEGPDIMGCNQIVFVGNTQRVADGVSMTGSSDFGGVLIDTGGGFGCTGVVVADNVLAGNPISFAPRAVAGNSIAQVTVRGNTVNGTRSTVGVKNCINLIDDPKADGTTKNFLIDGNMLYGSFAGLAIANASNVFPPSGYTSLKVRNNQGFNPQGPAGAVTVGASPFTYSNADCVPEAVYVDGGTVSRIDVTSGGNTAQVFSATGHMVWLEPGDSAVVYYTVAPTIIKVRA